MIADDIAQQLVYSTTRIVCFDSEHDKINIGTSFFINDGKAIYLVTNKHVVSDYKKAKIILSKNADGIPVDNDKIEISIDDLQDLCIGYPDVDDEIDLCLIFFTDIINGLRNSNIFPYIKTIGINLFINSDSLQPLSPIEDVVMIGYPIGIMDEVNNKPIVRKGITATSIKNDYNGLKEFLIDIPCFRGSSGSPVFLVKTGLQDEQTQDGLFIGIQYSYSFVGIVHAVSTEKMTGKIDVTDLKNNIVSEFEIPINLGHVIKVERINELLKIANERFVFSK